MADMRKWKGLPEVLAEISGRNPGVRLEHTLSAGKEGEAELRRGEPERRILPVERWLAIVREDVRRAPDPEARAVITGPYYFWDHDEFGRAVVSANDFGRIVPMFIEVWAGEPD